MIIKNSFETTIKNVRLVLKVVLYATVLLLICMALFFALVEPILNEFFYEFDISEKLKETVNGWLEGENGSFNGLLSEMSGFFSNRNKELTLTAVMFALIYTMMMFFVNLTALPITKALYDDMRDGLNQKFMYVFISSLGSSILYSLFSTLFGVVIDLLIIAFGAFFVSLMYSIFGYLGITLTLSIVLVLFTCRICLFNQWLPQMVGERKPFFEALKGNFSALPKSFLQSFVPVLVTVVALFVFIMSTALFTFAVSIIIAVPFYIVMLNAIGLLVHISLEQNK